MNIWNKNNMNLMLAAVIMITATIFFVTIQSTLVKENNDENNRENITQDIYKMSKENIKWNGYKWYAKQASQVSNYNSTRYLNEVVENGATDIEAIMVNILVEEENKIESLPLEDYVLAVTLNELPWSFQDEAIKAQMIAARTYIMYRLKSTSQSDREYDVTNSTRHQVFDIIDETKLTEQQKLRYMELKKLLTTTTGKVITYEGQPIDALYFSTSNGKTEAGKDYFGSDYPYLQSVSSKWDVPISTSYEKQFEFSYSDFLSRLNKARLLENKEKSIKIDSVERTTSNRIKSLKVNNTLMTAKKLREALGIASTDFTWQLDDVNQVIVIKTKGYGHGVGMSQWGAEGMAREGYTYDEILKHYYTDIKIESL